METRHKAVFVSLYHNTITTQGVPMQYEQLQGTLTINGYSVELSMEMLEDIARKLPDEKHYTPLLSILGRSNNPEIRENVALSAYPDQETIERLANDPSFEVVSTLLNNRRIKEQIPEATLLKIMERNDISLMIEIAKNVDDYEKCDICKLIKILSKHPNAKVRFELLNGRHGQFAKTIAAKLVNDPVAEIARKAKELLKED